MRRPPQQEPDNDKKAGKLAEPVVSVGNYRLRARQSKVDYCELKYKPEQRHRFVFSSKVSKNKAQNSPSKRGNASKEAPDHSPVQLPDKVEPWPVWIKHHDKGPPTYALWMNAADMMADPRVEGRFFICSSSRYVPVRNAVPVKPAQLQPGAGVLVEHDYFKRIKLGKAFQFPSGKTFQEGSPILEVLEYAWPSGSEPMKGPVSGNDLTPVSELRGHGAGLSVKNLLPLPECGEPVRVYVTYHTTNTTVYGLWTNAQAAIAAAQPWPLVFVQCKQHTYQPINPEVKYRNDAFYMLTGIPQNGKWREAVKLDQQLSIPGGPTFGPGTRLAQVFKTMSEMRSKNPEVQAPVHASGSKSGIEKESEQAAVRKGDPCVKHIGADTGKQNLLALQESVQPVRVHVTYHMTNTTVYGLWTNAKAAIEACQPQPLLFVQCEQDTYQPINPEVKYRNDKFYMLTGLPSSGGWRETVKLDQQLSVPGGPAFEIGTSIAQVFATLTKLQAEKRQSTCPAQPHDSKSEDGSESEETMNVEDEQDGNTSGNVNITPEQQGTTPSCEVIVIDNSLKEKQNDGSNNDDRRETGRKRPAMLPISTSRPRKHGRKEHPERTCSTDKKIQGNNDITNGRGMKRPAMSKEAKPDANAGKRRKNGQHDNAVNAAMPHNESTPTPPEAALQQPCSKPAATRSKGIPEATLPEPSKATPVNKHVPDIGPSSALQRPDNNQQQRHMTMTSLPPMSLDAQFNIDTDSALRILTALSSLLQSLNYGGKQAKQLWSGFHDVFLGEDNSCSSMKQKQQWATNYLQLAVAVASGDTAYVCCVLKDEFGIVP